MRGGRGRPGSPIKRGLGLCAIVIGLVIILTLVLPGWCWWLIFGGCLILAGIHVLCRR